MANTTLTERVDEYTERLAPRLPSDRAWRAVRFAPERIKAARLRAGWTIAYAARFCQVSASTFRNWEHGRSVPTEKQKPLIRQLEAIAAEFPELVRPEDIKFIRSFFDYCLKDLEQMYGIRSRTWLRWEAGTSLPKPDHRRALADSLALAKSLQQED